MYYTHSLLSRNQIKIVSTPLDSFLQQFLCCNSNNMLNINEHITEASKEFRK